MLNVTIDSRQIVNALNTAGSKLRSEAQLGLKQSCDLIVHDARITHRFVSKGNMLEASINTKIDGLTGIVYFNTGIATYGSFQHDGTITYRKGPKWPGNRGIRKTGGIRPDPFIHNAADNNSQEIIKTLARSITSGIKKAGLA